MPPNLTTPGVYINEVSTAITSVTSVDSAAPVFIGCTEKALDDRGQSLTNVPTKISSLIEFELYYGKAYDERGIKVLIKKKSSDGSIKATATITSPSPHNMYYSLQLYFMNGGGPCYLLSAGKYGNKAVIKKERMIAAINVLATIKGPTIIVMPEVNGLAENDYYLLVDQLISQCGMLQDRFMLVDVHSQPTTAITATIISNFRSKLLPNQFAQYAAAYYPNLITTLPYQYNAAQISVTISIDAGAAKPPVKLNTLSNDPAMYNAAKTAIDQLKVVLPPSPAIAGLYVAVDRSRGVWKAAANISLSAVSDLTKAITNSEQQEMNIDVEGSKSVNAIRYFTGKGLLVWGARTLDGNNVDWRYIPVRRFCIMVQQSIKKAIEPFVFQLNNAQTWVTINALLANYLTTLWRQGALQGDKPDNAFFVHIGLGKTMTANDIAEGNMIIEIGMAILKPAEFIVIIFKQKMQVV